MKPMIRVGDPEVRRILAHREKRSPYRADGRDPVPIAKRFTDGCWQGQTCFIVGGGSSLEGFDFDRLRGRGRVIAINKAFAHVPFADIMYAMDRPLLDDLIGGKLGEGYRQAFEGFRGAKVWLDISGYSYPDDVFVIKCAGAEGWSSSLEDGLTHGQHSGYSALNLAILLGADPIYLLGYDCKAGPEGKMHFHEGYPGAPNMNAANVFLRENEAGALALPPGGPRIVNLNPASALRAFPFGDVDEVAPVVRRARVRGRITAITPTGDRPLPVRLCAEWMAHQTRRVDEWIVVDDGREPMKPIPGTKHIRREPRKDDPKFTLDMNIEAALPHITGDKILIIEDDEYYAPGYVDAMSRRLDQYEVVGIMNSRYYHLPTGGVCINPNTGHASLAQTGFRGSFLPTFEALVLEGSHPRWLDDRMWAHIQARRSGDGKIDFLLFSDDDAPLYVGMKGLPGRSGIGAGHKKAMYRLEDEDGRPTLKQWIPKDYQVYLDILAGMGKGA